MTMAKTPGLACLLLAACSAEAGARCSVPYIQTFENQTVQGRMMADSGKPCRVRFGHSSGPTNSTDIVQRPANGTLRAGEVQALIYTSRPGFVGQDTFVYARRGLTKAGVPTVRTVRVSVTVTP
jgi:hypothetical protein